MTCNGVSQKIGSYLDGELSGSEMLGIRKHLQSCDACAEEAESLRSLKSAISNLPCLEAPEGLEDRLIAAIRAESAPAFAPTRRRALWGSAVAVAACAGRKSFQSALSAKNFSRICVAFKLRSFLSAQ